MGLSVFSDAAKYKGKLSLVRKKELVPSIKYYCKTNPKNILSNGSITGIRDTYSPKRTILKGNSEIDDDIWYVD